MPASKRSLQVTTAYQRRLEHFRDRLQCIAEVRWPTIEELDSSDWTDRMAAAVAQAQTEAIRATGGYLTAFLTSELGRRTAGPVIQSRAYAGKGADGRALAESLQSPLIGVYAALKKGIDVDESLRYGLDRATRQVGMDFDAAHRAALLDAIDGDERFEGWQRATTGTCGACAAVAGKVQQGLRFPVHPGCGCVSEPRVAGVSDLFPRATGTEIFEAKSEDEQNEMLGPLAAQMVREGRVEISELIEHEHLDSATPDFVTQKPVEQLVAGSSSS